MRQRKINGLLCSMVFFLILSGLLSSCSNSDDNVTAESRSVILYSIPDETFENQIDEIPFYSEGDIILLSDSAMKDFNEGHQPWHADPLMTVFACCQNLYNPYLSDNDEERGAYLRDSKETKDEILFNNGTSIKMIAQNDTVSEIKLTVVDVGTFYIKLKYPHDTGYYYIQEITCLKAQ